MSPIFDPDEYAAEKEAKRNVTDETKPEPCPLGCPGDPLIGCDHCYRPDDEACRCRACAPPRVLLVGEANPYGGDPSFALYPEPKGASGDRLCRKIMGLRGGQYLRAFDRVNLCTGKWSLPRAREEADRLIETPRKAIVLLGTKVKSAFGVTGPAFDVERRPNGMVLVILPHPSGLCREWGKPGAIDRARVVLTKAGVLPLPPRPEPAPDHDRKEGLCADEF